jgi:putative ABC transport system permease protein
VILFVTVAVVLLTACANLATLLLARATGRLGDIKIRLSLGANRWHLVRQSLAEATVIAAGGAASGLLATIWIRQIAMAVVPELRHFAIDRNVLLFTLGISAVSAVLIALAPALVSGQAVLPLHNRSRLRRGFVIAQLALAVALLTGAGVLVRSFANLQSTDPGFRSAGILVAEISLSHAPAYATGSGRTGFVAALLERCLTAPRVRIAAAATSMPLFAAAAERFEVQGRGGAESLSVAYRSITPDYFRLFDVSLRRGRYFDTTDGERAPRVVIINERAAALFWPSADPLGQRIRFGKGDWATVIGIAADTHSIGLRRPPVPEIFGPYAQNPTTQISVALRTDGEPLELLAGLRETLTGIDRGATITYSNSMPVLLDEQLALVRALSAFSSVFALVTLLLASMGLCGVVSHLFSQRTKEIGIRVALGARRADIIRMVAASSAKLTFWGLLVGNVAGVLIAITFRVALFGVADADVTVFATVTVIIALAGFSATFAPAMRSASIQPAVALRSE